MHEIIQTRTAHAGWAKFLIATVRAPDGSEFTREIEDHGSAVCVLPYNRARKTAVLVRQFRAPLLFAANQPDSLEAIAGLLDETDPAAGVRRESLEEAGLVLRSLQPLFLAWTMPGLSTERMHFFLGTYDEPPANRVHGVIDETEVVMPEEFALRDLAALVDAGRLTDLKTLVLMQTLRLREPALFA